MLYSGESKKVIVSMKPSEPVSDIWLLKEEESTCFVLFFDDVQCHNNRWWFHSWLVPAKHIAWAKVSVAYCSHISWS